MLKSFMCLAQFMIVLVLLTLSSAAYCQRPTAIIYDGDGVCPEGCGKAAVVVLKPQDLRLFK